MTWVLFDALPGEGGFVSAEIKRREEEIEDGGMNDQDKKNPMKHAILILTALLPASLAPLSSAAEAEQTPNRAGADKPNVLLLFADQHHADVMGCAGHSIVKTPNLDRLAANGVRFK